MNYEMLIERARNAANNTVCLVEPRHLHQMADALENQAKVVKSLEEIIWKQDRAIEGMRDGGCAELAVCRNQLKWAEAERDTVTKRMIQLEQELAQIKEGK